MGHIKYNKEMIQDAVNKSKSWANVARLLNRKPSTGSQSYIKKVAIKLGVNFDHFTGCSHNKGKFFPKKDAMEYCFYGSGIASGKLRQNLIRDGYKKYECEICKLTEWNGFPIPLELDHIDSDHENNTYENLQILCPNCHAIETDKRRPKKKEQIRKRKEKIINIKKNDRSHLRKVTRPSYEDLISMVNDIGYCATGRIYGVSDNAIRKWIKRYKIELDHSPIA